MAPADDLLKKLRRDPGNMACPNCETPAQRGIGFGNVCVKFKTFICDMCKTSHQAISHRVKSISMSSWELDEVKELAAAQNGGNEACRNSWLANAPAVGEKYKNGSAVYQGKRPKQGDPIENFKTFVIHAYEKRMFFGNGSGNTANAQQQSSSKAQANINAVPQTQVDLLGGDDPFQSSSGSAAQGSSGFDFFNAPPPRSSRT